MSDERRAESGEAVDLPDRAVFPSQSGPTPRKALTPAKRANETVVTTRSARRPPGLNAFAVSEPLSNRAPNPAICRTKF